MHKVLHAWPSASEDEVPTDLLASLLIEKVSAPPPLRRERDRVTPKIFAVMVLTSLLTFAILATGYELFFVRQVFA